MHEGAFARFLATSKITNAKGFHLGGWVEFHQVKASAVVVKKTLMNLREEVSIVCYERDY